MTKTESASIRGQTSPKPDITASRWFALIGWILIGTTLSGVVFTSLPVRLIWPEWQLQVISAILAGTISLLLGSLLVCGEFLLNPRNAKLQQRSDFLKRVSS